MKLYHNIFFLTCNRGENHLLLLIINLLRTKNLLAMSTDVQAGSHSSLKPYLRPSTHPTPIFPQSPNLPTVCPLQLRNLHIIYCSWGAAESNQWWIKSCWTRVPGVVLLRPYPCLIVAGNRFIIWSQPSWRVPCPIPSLYPYTLAPMISIYVNSSINDDDLRKKIDGHFIRHKKVWN